MGQKKFCPIRCALPGCHFQCPGRGSRAALGELRIFMIWSQTWRHPISIPAGFFQRHKKPCKKPRTSTKPVFSPKFPSAILRKPHLAQVSSSSSTPGIVEISSTPSKSNDTIFFVRLKLRFRTTIFQRKGFENHPKKKAPFFFNGGWPTQGNPGMNSANFLLVFSKICGKMCCTFNCGAASFRAIWMFLPNHWIHVKSPKKKHVELSKFQGFPQETPSTSGS